MGYHLAFILGIFSLLCLLGGWLYYGYRGLYITKQLLQAERGIHQYILANLPSAWCYWYSGEAFVECSNHLRLLLGIEADCPVQVNDLCKILGDSSFSPFQRALSHITDFGGEFNLILPLGGQALYLEIEGRSLSPLPIAQRQPFTCLKKNHNIILLSFRDITQSVLEKNHNQQAQKQKDQEIAILKTLVNNLPLAVWYRDQHGRLRYTNALYAQILEISPHRILAENIEFIDLSQPRNAYELSKQALLTGQKQTLKTHKVIHGKRHLLEVAEIPIAEMGVTVGHALDITPLEKAENELYQHLSAHREVLQHISVPIAIFGPNTELTFFNQAYLRLFDFDENWLYTEPTYGEILENLRERRKLPEYPNFLEYKHQSLALFKNLMQPMHELLHLPEGHILRTVIAPHPLGGLIFLFDDMTDKLSLERGYNTLVAVQKETLDHLYEGVVVFGTDNRLRLSNPAMGKIWNLQEEDRTIGRHISDILKDVAPLFINPYESRMWRKKLILQVSSRQANQGKFLLKGNRMVDYSYVPLPDGSNLLTFVDVSDRWRFEQSLRDQTITLQPTLLKSDVVSHVSHELRAPLNAINGFNEILLNQYFGTLNERQLEYCQGIAVAGARLEKVMNDMIELANIEAGNLKLNYQKVDLEDFIKSTIDLVQNRVQSQELDITLENHLPIKVIEVDSQRLRHAILNLLINAIEFTPTGGHILVKITPERKKPDYFRLVIQDTGIGIPPEERERILQPLDRTSSQSNTGLGLQLVKSLIELHGGTFHIESVVPQGTKMVCCLPMQACF